MKISQSKLLIICLLSALLFNACTKVTLVSNNSSASTANSFTFKVDGVAKSESLVITTIYTTQNGMQISGFTTGGDGVGLMVNSLKTGTYDVVNDGLILSYGTDSTYPNTFLASSGTLTITSLTSTTIAGTFSFTGSNPAGATKVITEGKFSCNKLIKL